MAKTSGNVTFMARAIITVLKSGSTPITDAEVAVAMLQTEQAVNNMSIPEVIEDNKTIQPYIRLHIIEEIDKKGAFKNGNNKD